MARNKKTGEVYHDVIIGSDGYIYRESREMPKNTYATGWGNERAYITEDGFTYHIPRRTEMSHPYSFDPIVQFNTGMKHEAAVYHDRMQQWDYEKFMRCMKEAGNVEGGTQFRWSNRGQVTKLMQLYNDDPKLVVTKCVKTVNMASGYPIWVIFYNPGPKKDTKKA